MGIKDFADNPTIEPTPGTPTINELVADMWAIDKIATLLGTSSEWKGADYLQWIADIIGSVRPHPGDNDGDGYAIDFRNATGRDVVLDFDERQTHEGA